MQGGTSAFSADCVTQRPTGPTLDEQLHGALTAARSREASRRRGPGCTADPSYVVPSMMCGGLVALRAFQAMESDLPLPAIRWRSGRLPMQESQNHAVDFAQLAT